MVHRGDTLSWISRCTGVDLSRLIEAGDITDPDLLRIGQRIEIPAPPAAPRRSAASTTPPTAPSAVPRTSAASPTAAPVVAVVTVTVTVAPTGVRR